MNKKVMAMFERAEQECKGLEKRRETVLVSLWVTWRREMGRHKGCRAGSPGDLSIMSHYRGNEHQSAFD